jgi:hypothetical protein
VSGYTTRRGANHGLHLALTLLTCGMWAITGWPIAAIIGRRTRVRVYGQAPIAWFPPPPPVAVAVRPPHQTLPDYNPYRSQG